MATARDGPGDVFALHHDGSGWTEITGAPPARGAFAVDADTIYTGAGYDIGHGISLFDGQRSTVVADFPGLNVHVFEGERGPGCSGWIVGRERVGGKKPFAAKLDTLPRGGFRGRTTSWTVAGGTSVGFEAAPSLTGAGSVLPGGAFTLSLADGPALSTSTLVVGFATSDPPQAGGVRVPTRELLLPGPLTDADGRWTLQATWPADVPAGGEVWFQVRVADPASPFGWRLTRPLRAATR